MFIYNIFLICRIFYEGNVLYVVDDFYDNGVGVMDFV